MVVRLLSKAVSRILAELHVLSKGIILELISSFKIFGCKIVVVSSTHEIFSATKIFQATVRSVASIVPFKLPVGLSGTYL